MQRNHTIAVTGGVFALAALLFALPGLLPAAIAQSEPLHTLTSKALKDVMPVPLDPRDLVRWDFKADPGVSTEPLHQSTVRKIAYGHNSFVSIVETSTGVYSSDAITDPHVRYPGVYVERRQPHRSSAWIWNGDRWARFSSYSAHSFVSVIPYKGGRLVTTDEGQCAVTRTLISC